MHIGAGMLKLQRVTKFDIFWDIVGDFTFWLSPWLSLLAETKDKSERSTFVLVQTED